MSFFFKAECWKQYQQEFPRMSRMVRRYLTVSASSVSPEGLFCSVGLVKSDLWGREGEENTS